jgi:hypothetical protein
MFLAGNIGDITPDYASLLPLTDDAPALVAEINLVLAANQLSAATMAAIAGGVAPIKFLMSTSPELPAPALR